MRHLLLGFPLLFLASGVVLGEGAVPVLPGGAPIQQGLPIAEGPGASSLIRRQEFFGTVEPLLRNRCQGCHRAGGIAPFPLETYDQVSARRDLIRMAVSERRMPPWPPAPGCGEFQDDRSLTSAERETLLSWISTGMAPGDAARALPPKSYPATWELGAPDLVLQSQEPYTPDFTKGDSYRCFVLPASTTEDRFVKAVEVRPGAASLVHHVLLFVDPKGESEALDAKDPGPGYTCFGGPGFNLASSAQTGASLGGWAPGARPTVLPDGVGFLLPKGSRVVMQVHYSRVGGSPIPDRTAVGLHFATSPVKKRFLVAPVVNQTFRIPAGAKNHPVRAAIDLVPVSVHVHAVAPHMHLLGKSMRVSTTDLWGKERCLIDVPDWDFHWQGLYFYKDPVPVPLGSRVDLLATYDNSEDNPENPSRPPVETGWGENTTDEMCLAFLGLTIDAENLNGSADSPPTDLATFPPFWIQPPDAGASPRASTAHP